MHCEERTQDRQQKKAELLWWKADLEEDALHLLKHLHNPQGSVVGKLCGWATEATLPRKTDGTVGKAVIHGLCMLGSNATRGGNLDTHLRA